MPFKIFSNTIKSGKLTKTLSQSIASYIDEHYVDQCNESKKSLLK